MGIFILVCIFLLFSPKNNNETFKVLYINQNYSSLMLQYEFIQIPKLKRFNCKMLFFTVENILLHAIESVKQIRYF